MELQKKTMILCLRNEMFREKKRLNPLVIGGRVFNYMDIRVSNPLHKHAVLVEPKNMCSIFSFLSKKIENPNPLLCNQVAVKKEEDQPGTLFIFFIGFGLGYLFRSSFIFQRFR